MVNNCPSGHIVPCQLMVSDSVFVCGVCIFNTTLCVLLLDTSADALSHSGFELTMNPHLTVSVYIK